MANIPVHAKYANKDDISFNIHDDMKGCSFCFDPKNGKNIGIITYWLFDGRSFKEKESDFDERIKRDESTSKFYASKSLTVYDIMEKLKNTS